VDLGGFDFLLDEAAVSGSLKRIGYAGESHGPSLDDLDGLRDRMTELRAIPSSETDRKLRVLAAALPLFLRALGGGEGRLAIEGVTVQRLSADTLVTLAKATMRASLTGLDGEKTGLRLRIGHEGLDIAASLTPANRVPHRAVFDIGIEEISTAALRTLADAAGHSLPEASDDERQQAMAQLLATAMSLQPVLRLHELAIDFKDVGVEGSGEARRAPPMPIGYAASGEVRVRGFDALADLVTAPLIRAQLPLVKFIGAPDKAPDGTPIVKFHLASAPGHTLAVNGSDLIAWFDTHVANSLGPSPRILRLAEPPLSGDDVRAIQKALPPGGERFRDGVYDSATALAVARFQKQAGLNVDGVVNAATRDKLGIKPPPAPAAPAPAKPPPKN
jgi:hypothetical protein